MLSTHLPALALRHISTSSYATKRINQQLFRIQRRRSNNNPEPDECRLSQVSPVRLDYSKSKSLLGANKRNEGHQNELAENCNKQADLLIQTLERVLLSRNPSNSLDSLGPVD